MSLSNGGGGRLADQIDSAIAADHGRRFIALKQAASGRVIGHRCVYLLRRQKPQSVLFEHLNGMRQVGFRVCDRIRIRRQVESLCQSIHLVDGIKKAAGSDQCELMDFIRLKKAPLRYIPRTVELNLRGKIAVVTGASKGIGLEITKGRPQAGRRITRRLRNGAIHSSRRSRRSGALPGQ
jgi:hypothetical protein